MLRNKKLIAATLAIMLGAFTFAECTKDAAGVTENSVEPERCRHPWMQTGKMENMKVILPGRI